MTPEAAARRILRLLYLKPRAEWAAVIADIVRAAQDEAVREYAAKVQGLAAAVEELLASVEGNQHDA
jgi:hypothetical protein